MDLTAQKTVLRIEKYLFNPSFFEKLLSYLLLPFSTLYCVVVIVKRKRAKEESFGIPVISIGNLTVGGNGKTPFCISLAKRYKNSAIILRGYKRKSKGTVVISKNGEILENVDVSGDEAMLFAKSLSKSTVIVSEDRKKGIKKAISLGSEVIFLDDGFSKADIKKYDILLKPQKEYSNPFCIPSGPYREPESFERYADIVAKEGVDFKRVVSLTNKTKRMLLVTAISKPKRLDEFLPFVVGKVYYPDHYEFKKDELEKLIKEYNADSLLTTQKDAVKMERFGLNLSILELDLEIDDKIIRKIDTFISDFGKIP